MSDYIPPDAITNILHRLGVNDLVRCRCVSKKWMSIIDSPRFISDQLHRSQATNSNAALFLRTNKEGNENNNLLYWRPNNASSISSSPLAPMQYLNQHSKVKLMGSCNGLICYIHFNHTHNDLVVLNPSTGERHTVYSFISNEKVAEMVGYGFGYDELSNDYNVVWLTRSGSSDVAEIYNIRGKGFSGRIPSPVMLFMGIIEEQRGVFVGGALHWFFFDLSGLFMYVILALDLGSNTFRMLPHPNYDFSSGKMTDMTIGIVGSCLSVCSFYKEDGLSKVSIFVMRDYGNGDSWNKMYSFQDPVPESVISLGSNGDRVLLKLDGCKIVWLDEVEETATLMNLEDGSFDAVFCLESLVKVFPVRDEEEDDEEVKRKEHEKKLAEQEKTWKNSGPSVLDLISAMDISSRVNMFREI